MTFASLAMEAIDITFDEFGVNAVYSSSGGQSINVRVKVNVDNRVAGTEAQVQTRRDGSGNLSLDIVVDKVEGRLARNIGRGEGLAPTLERRYGLNPAAGSY